MHFRSFFHVVGLLTIYPVEYDPIQPRFHRILILNYFLLALLNIILLLLDHITHDLNGHSPLVLIICIQVHFLVRYRILDIYRALLISSQYILV